MLEQGKIVLVAGFQGVTQYGAITTLGRGGSDTTASALGAALKPFADEIAVEIYTDVDGVKTADPRLVSEARTLPCASYEEVAEMAHMGAKVVHPRAAEIANQYRIPLWVKSTFVDAPGTLIASGDALPVDVRLRVTGVTHTGKIVYLRFELPTGDEDDKAQLELEIYRLLQREQIALYLNNTHGGAFAFAISRDHLARVRALLNGLVVPVASSRQDGIDGPALGRIYLLGVGVRQAGFDAQKALLEKAGGLVEMHSVQAEVVENCTVVSVIAAGFAGVPGVMARILGTLADVGVPVYQTADSDYSISVLIPEGDARRATEALHTVLGLKGNPAAAADA